jgi:acyl carrier protein
MPTAAVEGPGNNHPSREGVRARVASLINEIAKVPLDQITEEATIDEQLQMQSVIFVELQVAIEEEYGIQVDLIHVVELNRFGPIVDYVHQCTQEARDEALGG